MKTFHFAKKDLTTISPQRSVYNLFAIRCDLNCSITIGISGVVGNNQWWRIHISETNKITCTESGYHRMLDIISRRGRLAIKEFYPGESSRVY